MLAQSRDLLKARDLLLAWTVRNIRGRYQQSALGWLWAIVQPAGTAIIFSIIFTQFVTINTGDTPYILFSYTAMVPWMLFATSLSDMIPSIVINMDLVKKIYFPREVLPIAAMLARLMDFGVASVLIVILLIIFKAPFFPLGWLYLPIILAIQILLILGVGLAGAASNVFFRDVQSLITLIIQIWFYASPIIYPVEMVPERLQPLYFFNPMAGVISAYRDILLNGRLPGVYLIPSGLVTLILFIFGYWFFKKVEFKFADII